MSLLASAACVAAITLGLVGCANSTSVMPGCSRPDDPILVLEAQAVPTSTQLPCVSELPVGWQYAGFAIRDGVARFWLDSNVGGPRAIQVELTPSCDVSNAVPLPPVPDEPEATVFERPDSLAPAVSGTRFLRVEGGCITYRYAFTPGAPATLLLEAEQALGMVPRSVVVQGVRDELGLSLCGSGAPPCAG